MNFQWKKEWNTPAIGALGVVASGAAAFAGFKYGLRKGEEDREVVLHLLQRQMELSEQAVAQYRDANARAEALDLALTQANGELESFRKENLDAEESGTDVPEDVRESAPVSYDSVTRLEPKVEENLLSASKRRSVFEGEDWDPNNQEEERAGDSPYILHEDEFFRNDPEHRQIQLTWYEGDKVLTDPENRVIGGPEKVVGALMWGRGSSDPDVLYIRNEANRADYEVHRHPGSYMTEILGIQAEEASDEDELKHSQRIPKFRPNRD